MIVIHDTFYKKTSDTRIVSPDLTYLCDNLPLISAEKGAKLERQVTAATGLQRAQCRLSQSGKTLKAESLAAGAGSTPSPLARQRPHHFSGKPQLVIYEQLLWQGRPVCWKIEERRICAPPSSGCILIFFFFLKKKKNDTKALFSQPEKSIPGSTFSQSIAPVRYPYKNTAGKHSFHPPLHSNIHEFGSVMVLIFNRHILSNIM